MRKDFKKYIYIYTYNYKYIRNIRKERIEDEELSLAFTPISLLTASNRQHAFRISNDSNLSNVFH